MEKLYAIRDAFFWWAGVWGTVTIGNRVIREALKRRRRDGRKHEHTQWKQEFLAFLFDEDARPDGTEVQNPEEIEVVTKPKATTEEPEADNVTES